MTRRVDRLNSLLKEVISEVVRRDVRHPKVGTLITVTRVEVTKDLHYAKVFVSVIGEEAHKAECIKALNSAAGFIAVNASKKVTLRYFPALTFHIDDSLEAHMRIDQLLQDIEEEKKKRGA
jgi:ribosome-binding factor A